MTATNDRIVDELVRRVPPPDLACRDLGTILAAAFTDAARTLAPIDEAMRTTTNPRAVTTISSRTAMTPAAVVVSLPEASCR